MTKILIGDPSAIFAKSMHDCFLLKHFSVKIEQTGWRVQTILRNDSFDLIILSTDLVGINTLDIVRNYRLTGGSTPIILLSEKHCSTELELGLDAGADEYLSHPISLTDLSARVRAALRRPELSNQTIYSSGKISINVQTGSVTRENTPVHLHPMEFKLLHFLMKHPNQVFDANALSERVWCKENDQAHETVRTHIRTLRQKLDSVGTPSIVTTVRGLGYKTENHPRKLVLEKVA